MYQFVLLVISLLPLVGLSLMEGGAYGNDIYQYGYPNGASAAYALHLAVMLGAYLGLFALLRRTVLPSLPGAPLRVSCSRDEFRRLAVLALAINVAMLAFVYYVSGAWAVVAGLLHKGEFRSQVRFGYLAYLFRDFLSPMVSALVAYFYMRTEPRLPDRALLLGSLAVTGLAGGIWGYRSTMLMMLIPACMLLIRRITLFTGAAVLGAALGAAVVFGVIYERVGPRAAFDSVVTRATTGVANTTWLIWEIETTAPEIIPPYAPTLVSALGARAGALAGVDQSGPLDVSNPRDYTTLTTLIAKQFSTGNYVTSNVTTGVFAEGVLALSSRWFLAMSLLAGVVVAINRAFFEHGVSAGRPLLAVLAANYFMVSIFSWLSSGGITVLVLVPFLVNYALTFLFGLALLRAARMRRMPAWFRPRRLEGRAALGAGR